MPSLILHRPVVTFPAPDTITFIVNVDEQSNCAGRQQLHIQMALTNSAGLTLSQEANFTDTNVTFGSLSYDEYNCTLDIVEGRRIIESSFCGNITSGVPLIISIIITRIVSKYTYSS